jgi:hypothetical protein
MDALNCITIDGYLYSVALTYLDEAVEERRARRERAYYNAATNGKDPERAAMSIANEQDDLVGISIYGIRVIDITGFYPRSPYRKIIPADEKSKSWFQKAEDNATFLFLNPADEHGAMWIQTNGLLCN